ncbi:MAG TPA: potassium channel family protein [Planctomycetaceae bacterium]|jgi:hypothetical protein|nr:potassium channel family protein [Planctomycetaceae bacterium]
MSKDLVEAANIAPEIESRRRPALHFSQWSAVEFLIAMIVFLCASPFIVEIRHGREIEAVLLTLVLASAALAVSERRSIRITAIVLAVPAIASRWVHYYRPDLLPITASLSAAMLFLGFVLVQYFRYILRAPIVNLTVICAGVSTYLMLGMLWTMAYMMLTSIRPDSFALNTKPLQAGAMTGFDAFYFSFVTLSTVGYGDIVPVTRAARMLAVMESTTGTLFVAILIARLVAIHASSHSRR